MPVGTSGRGVVARDPHAARGRRDHAHHELGDGRLAGARPADYPGGLTLRHRQAHVVDGHDRLAPPPQQAAATVGDGDAVEFDQVGGAHDASHPCCAPQHRDARRAVDGDQARRSRADFAGVLAARGEPAARQRLGDVGRCALDRRERDSVVHDLHSTQQCAGVRVARGGEDLLGRALLDHLARRTSRQHAHRRSAPLAGRGPPAAARSPSVPADRGAA